MPVTVRPTPENVGINKDPLVFTADDLHAEVSKQWTATIRGGITNKKAGPEDRKIIQSSFYDPTSSLCIVPYNNGLVHSIVRAFNQDLHLVLRPDDIWLAILTQFSFFVNGNAEQLRTHFVAHEGRKQLTVDVRPFPPFDVDMGVMAQEFVRLIHRNVVDPELSAWALPRFSTTTDDDVSVAAVVFMATMQSYFEYDLLGGCGFPSVTLLGEKSDWEEILRRVRKLPQYGDDAEEWSRLLVATIKRMVRTFDFPGAQETKDFWLQACHAAGVDGSGGGQKTLSGWITAFCFFTDKGKRTEAPSVQELQLDRGTSIAERKLLVLDNVVFPLIHPEHGIPKGVVTVPVVVKDFEKKLVYKTTMAAGSMGVSVSYNRSSVQPKSGWLMLQDSIEPF